MMKSCAKETMIRVLYLLLASITYATQSVLLNDPVFEKQWYLGSYSSKYPGRHNNIKSAWQQGASGKGVLVAVMDNGVEIDHDDLKQNINIESSYDYVSNRKIPLPYSPRGIYKWQAGHGTRIAGIIGMQANNSKCGVGVAFNAKIAVLKVVSNEISSSKLARAYQHMLSKVDIFSSSHGPPDTGKFASRPLRRQMNAFWDGVSKGRNGLGSIYVRASGNGRPFGDHCGADGTVNNIYSIAVASAARDHSTPYYSEECASILTSAYSQHTKWFLKGYYTDIITTGLGNQCEDTQGGSSTATAIVSGIIALALSSRKNLSWRDVQYLVVASSSRNALSGAWMKNGAGFNVSHKYGFGILNAGKMVSLAKTWLPVDKQIKRYSGKLMQRNVFTGPGGNRPKTLRYAYRASRNSGIRYIEQVSITTTIYHQRRGDIAIYLKSPKGTRSELLGRRINDDSRRPYTLWKFTSVHFWGEPSDGEWILQVLIYGEGSGYIKNTFMAFYGTQNKVHKLYEAKNEIV